MKNVYRKYLHSEERADGGSWIDVMWEEDKTPSCHSFRACLTIKQEIDFPFSSMLCSTLYF